MQVLVSGKRLKYLLAILNSSLMDFYFPLISTEIQGNTRRYFKQYVELCPIKDCQKDNISFESLVDCIQFGHSHGLEYEAKTLEALVDVMVYGLYFEAEMRAAGCYINERVAEIVQPFKDTDDDEFKADYVKKLAEYCGKDSIIYAGLIHSRNVKSVQAILKEQKE